VDVSAATKENDMKIDRSFVNLAEPMVAGALLAILIAVAVVLGPVALQRWF
jgi:hypothetical protein